jgi:hypothetical protein
MGEIVNLKSVRKQRAREEESKLAEQNRLKFGQTKAEKQLTRLESKRAAKTLDDHKIDT